MQDLEKIVSFCKRKGFIYPSSELYGGVSGIWDYGPLGSLLKQNLRNLWIKRFAQEKENVELIEGSILMNPKVWVASGHVENFTDPLVECKKCNFRYRADHLEEGKFKGEGKAKEAMQCPNCGAKEFTPPRNFNLMFKTFLSPVEDQESISYLRPETAQSMFVDFQSVLNSSRQKLPFGIAQIGKCFRNEIASGDFTFRSREFEIAEIEFFVKPGEDEKWFDFWIDEWEKFFFDLGISKENLRRYEHPKEKLSHYSKRTIDPEYKFPFGWAELAGCANRTDFDLKRHSEFSGQDLSYFDEETKEKYIPYVIEPTMGLDRLVLALLCEAYTEVEGGRTTTTESVKETEVVLRLDKKIAPIKAAVFPLVKNKPELVEKAREIFANLQKRFMCQYDETGSVGRRYRRQDEIGTPYCITVDFETLENGTVTVRDRDTMEQERVAVEILGDYVNGKINS